MMIQVKVGNNVSRNTVLVDSARTLKSVLEENGIEYVRGGITLDGATVPQLGGLDKTFDDYGIKESCWLLQVVKADNA